MMDKPLAKSNHPNIISLTDGRILAYAEFGDPQGIPLLFFHGGNDSRLAGELWHQSADQMGVRVIASDRPGYGRSDFQPQRTFLDWAADTTNLLDALEIRQAAVAGHSGGGPHAAACALAMPERLQGVALISSAAPPGSPNKGMHPMFRIINFFMGYSPWLHRMMTEQTVKQLIETPENFFKQWGMMSKADGYLFAQRPDVTELIAAEMIEAVEQGIEGILHEHPLYKRPWGFNLADITLPVQVWHGLSDPQAAPAWGQNLVDQLPRATAHFVPNEGHFSLLINHQKAILKSIFPAL